MSESRPRGATPSMVRMATVIAALVSAAMLTACEPYRIEYRKRPAYYNRLVDSPLPEQVTLDDGTIVLYNADPGDDAIRGGRTGAAKKFSVREEADDGSITLRAILPEHVVANLLHCLRQQEYQLVWDQLLSEEAKIAYESEGLGPENFAEYLATHRIELAKMLNRMRMGLSTHEVVVETQGNVVMCRFWPQVEKLFRFKRVYIVRENFNLKLLAIR